MRSYLSLGLSFCLMFAVGCSDDAEGGAGSGGTAGTGGTAGSGGDGGAGGTGGTGGGNVEMKNVTLGCSNSFNGTQSILDAELSVDAPAIAGGSEFEVLLTGTATFPEAFLDVANLVVPGGLRAAELIDLKYIVQVRSGATGDDVTLGVDVSQLSPGEIRLCNFPSDQQCTENSDCQGQVCEEPKIIVEVPTSDDCAPGGFCETEGKANQCEGVEFCIAGDLNVPLLAQTGTYTAEASGEVLFGWADQGLTNNTFDEDTGTYTVPKPELSNPLEQGIFVNASGIAVLIECVMGNDGGEVPGSDDNIIEYTPDEDLISVPIIE